MTMYSITKKSMFVMAGALILSVAAFAGTLNTVNAQMLTAEISADPASGPSPLNNVSLTADVSGTASGDITYRFDCQGDGSWDHTHTTSSTTYTADDLCDYTDSGSHSPKVEVERDGLAFTGSTAVFVGEDSLLTVDLSANPTRGDAPLNDVDLIADVAGSATGDITYRFDCTSNGTWDHTHTTSSTSYTARNLCDYQTEDVFTAKVEVERGGHKFTGSTLVKTLEEDDTPTEIPTGAFSAFPFNPFMVAGALSMILLVTLTYAMLLKFYLSNQLIPAARKTKTEREFERALERARQNLR